MILRLILKRKFEILAKFEKIPRDSSRIRIITTMQNYWESTWCLSKFGLCRNELRRRAMLGEVPGLVKASW